MAAILKEDPELPEGDVSPALSRRPAPLPRKADRRSLPVNRRSRVRARGHLRIVQRESTREQPSIPWRTMAVVIAALLASLTAIY
jgi:hypothetical protein